MTIFKQNGAYRFRVISANIFILSRKWLYFFLYKWYILILSRFFDIVYTFQGVFKEFVNTFLFSRAFQVPLKMNFKLQEYSRSSRSSKNPGYTVFLVCNHCDNVACKLAWYMYIIWDLHVCILYICNCMGPTKTKDCNSLNCNSVFKVSRNCLSSSREVKKN
jgi:hypothetical protein